MPRPEPRTPGAAIYERHRRDDGRPERIIEIVRRILPTTEVPTPRATDRRPATEEVADA